MVDPINESPLRDLMKEFEDAIGRQDRAGAVALMRPFREEKDRYGTREIAGSSVVIRAREGLWPTNEQLADALRMAVFAGDEVDPELLLFIADALEQKADRRAAPRFSRNLPDKINGLSAYVRSTNP